MIHEYGWLAMVPPLVVIILSVRLKMAFEAMLIGCLVGLIMLDGWGFFDGLIEALNKVLTNKDSVWVILVCGLYGSLMGLMVRSGGAMQFGELMLRRIRNRRLALLGTWGLGGFVFLDDYLSALTVGITMRKITDQFGISREKLAYITNATAANICLLIPISTWALFISPQLESAKIATEGQGLMTYISMIPFIAFSWIAVLVALFVALGILPDWGAMRTAENRAKNGQTIPSGIKIAQVTGLDIFDTTAKKSTAAYFLVPLFVLLIATVAFQDTTKAGIEIDALKGVMIGVAFTFIFLLLRRVATFQQLSETVFSGFNSMIYALALLMLSLVLKDVCERMGLTNYVIAAVTPYVNAALMPLTIFVALSLIGYTTGSSWGLYVVAIPIAASLATNTHGSVFACVGAVISAGALASNMCLYSDATVLTSQSCETNNLEHHNSQLPYLLLTFGLTCIMYLIFGYFG